MTQPEEFYVSVGFAIKNRDHARSMIQKWTDKAEMWEARIEKLINPSDEEPEVAEEQEA